MFKKLRQKVEASDSPEKDDSKVKARLADTDRGQVAKDIMKPYSDLPRASSTSALTLAGQAGMGSTESLTESSSKRELVEALATRTMQVKKLEVKIAEYESMLKRSTKDKDKLMSTLESHQDGAIRKIAEMEKEFTDEKNELNAKLIKYEKQQNDFEETMQALIQENDKLQSSLAEWRKREEDFQRRREFENDAELENDEDLKDFQTQEVAKIKHMLMICEKKCSEKEDELAQKDEELKQCREGKQELEISLRSATESLNATRKELESQIHVNEELQTVNEKSCQLLATLENENEQLKHELLSLNKELEELKTALTTSEETTKGDCRAAAETPNNTETHSEDTEDVVPGTTSMAAEAPPACEEETAIHNDVGVVANGPISADGEGHGAELREWMEKYEEALESLQMREEELMLCKAEVANLKNDNTEESEEITTLKSEMALLKERVAERDRSLKLQQQRMNDLKKALNKELNKRTSNTSTDPTTNPKGRVQKETNNGSDATPGMNGGDDFNPDLAIGSTSVDDPSLSMEQREITVKYLKHVVLTFLSCGQSEGQQLVRALTMLLNLSRDEEKFVRETLQYRESWFGVRPSTKVVKSSVRQMRR